MYDTRILSCAGPPKEVLELVASDGTKATLTATGDTTIELGVGLDSEQPEVEQLAKVSP